MSVARCGDALLANLSVYLQMLKFIDLRKTPSLEIGLMLVFSYAPYALAEGLHLSGTVLGRVGSCQVDPQPSAKGQHDSSATLGVRGCLVAVANLPCTISRFASNDVGRFCVV